MIAKDKRFANTLMKRGGRKLKPFGKGAVLIGIGNRSLSERYFCQECLKPLHGTVYVVSERKITPLQDGGKCHHVCKDCFNRYNFKNRFA